MAQLPLNSHILLGVLLLSGMAWAEPTQTPNCSPFSITTARLEARKLLDNAEQAPDRPSRVRSLEAAYRLYQDPLILYNLGTLWYNAGRRVEGADLLRRYLYEAGPSVNAERRDRLARMIARLNKPTGELDVLSEPCSFVYADGRLVGRAPLSLPLLLRAGNHLIEVEKDHRRQRVTVPMGTGNRQVPVPLPATVVMLAEGGDPADEGRLLGLAGEGVAAEKMTPIAGKARDAVVNRMPMLRGCLTTVPCQEELARQLQAQYVLILRMDAPDRVAARLLDVDAGVVTVSQSAACTGCDAEAMGARIGQLSREVLRSGQSVPKGTLELTSVPEAEITIDGRKAGKTPFLRSALPGSHLIQLTAVGYRPHEAKIQVEHGKRAVLGVALRAEGEVTVQGAASIAVPFNLCIAPTPECGPRAGPPSVGSVAGRDPDAKGPAGVAGSVLRGEEGRGPRPIWRLAVGGVAMGLGVGLAGFGGSALAIDGQCGPAGVPAMPEPGMPCQQVYRSVGPGSAMIGAGAALFVGGLITVIWPGPHKAQPVLAPASSASGAASSNAQEK
jgi:hypothetical protein